jgi:hypothetical protein
MLGKFGLEKLVFRAGEEVRFGAGDGGDQVVDDDGLAVEGALLVGVGGQLDGNDGAGLFGDDGPEVAVVAGYGEGQEGFQRAGVEVGEEDGGGVRGQAGGGAAAVGGDVEENLGGSGLAAVTLTAEPLTVALNCTWRRWLAGERRSVLERA